MKNKFEVGQTVWLIPTGNNVKRGKVSLREQISSDAIESVGRTVLKLKKAGKINIYGALDKHNCGYIPFGTKEEALEFLEAERLTNYIRRELYTIKPTFKQITQIFEVLGIEIPESMA